MDNNSIIEIESLTHRYGDRTAVDNVSLGVGRGSIVALLGPNGSGKTTLFKILTTLLTPTSGAARIGGYDVVRQQADVRHRIGIVFQNPSLDVRLSVAENLTCQGHLYGLRGSDLRERIQSSLARFGLSDRARDRVETLSGGLQRRVELAKSLLHRPQVLILDEPSTGLDPGARATLMDQLIELRDQDSVTSLITTHLMDEANRCDRVAILDNGKLVAHDDPAALKSRIGGDVVTIQTTSPNELAKRAEQKFAVTATVIGSVVRIEREKGHEFVPHLIEAFPGEIDSVTVGRPTLDDVFLHLTGHALWNGSSGFVDVDKGRAQ